MKESDSKSDTANLASASCCNTVTYLVLLLFSAIAVGTIHWGVAIYSVDVEAVDCSSDIDW